ncbi:MAG: taurine dioxygenase [Rhizobiales bacterium]|nr:taurine dioxygenase [Hyphomicrobiales bacterium]
MNAPVSLAVRPLAPALGAIVDGVDLARPLTPALVEALKAALVTHHVLFFEQQSVTPATQRAAAALFGDLHIHPIYPHVEDVPEIIVLDTSANNLPDNDNWHTDVTFIQNPPLGALLAAKQLPPSGGDTSWSSTIAAYEALSLPLRTLLDGLTAVHDIQKSFPFERWAVGGNEDRWQEARRKNPPVIHPVVRVHPVTGRKGLFVNEGFTTRIVELSATESDAVLRLLFAHVAKPEFTIRWRWKEGDVAFWDNRLTQHYALADYLPHRRIMHRATILGDRPVGPEVDGISRSSHAVA